MDSMVALTTVCLIFACGDFISTRTRSMVSTMLVALILLLVGFWTKLPSTLFEDAGLLKLGGILIPFLITHMGTLLSLSDLKEQWKTGVISLAAVGGIALALIIIGIPLLGRDYAISAAPPLSGGVVAAIIMGERANLLGMEHIAIFTTLIVVIQQFFGIPIASFLLNKEAKNLIEDPKKFEAINLQADAATGIDKEDRKRLFPPLPENLQTSYILFAKLAIAVFIGTKISQLTNGFLNHFVVCLFIGVVFKEIGFLEENILVKANGFGLAMLTLMAVIFNSLSQATPSVLLSLVKPILGSLAIAIFGIVVVSLLAGKLFGFSKEMSISIGLSALFGFPGTFILPSEVANAVGRNSEERQAILNHILPKMLVAGFVTVTIASVILAGIMVNML